MFDHVAPEIFWPLLTLFSGIAGLAVTWLFATLVDGTNPKRRFEQHDHVAEKRRRTDHRGFKSRMGAR